MPTTLTGLRTRHGEWTPTAENRSSRYSDSSQCRSNWEARSPPVTEGDPNWYDWRLENWGTKWDTDEVVLSKDKKGLHYCFCCAWSGPVQAIEQISAEFPALTFRLRHADEAMDWDEELLFRKGIVLERTAATFDIPATRQYWGCEPRCRNCGCDEDVCECSGLQELAAMTRD